MKRQFIAFVFALLAVEVAGRLASHLYVALLPFVSLELRMARSGSLLFAYLAGVIVWELLASKDGRWKGFTAGSHRSLLAGTLACICAMGSAGVAALFHTGDWGGIETGVLSVFGLQELGVTLIGAAAEEIWYRYLILGAFARFTHSRIAGLLAATALFTLMHGRESPAYFIAAGGLLFGAIFVYTGSIWPSIAVHFFVNVLAMVLFSTSPLAHPILLGPTEWRAFQVSFATAALVLSLGLLWRVLGVDPLIRFFGRPLSYFNRVPGTYV